jgi:hypothetical protein
LHGALRDMAHRQHNDVIYWDLEELLVQVSDLPSATAESRNS